MTYTGSRGWNFAKSLRSVSICSSIDNRLLDRLCEEWISPSIDRSTSRWMMIGNGHKFVKTGFWEIGKAIDSWTINQTIDAFRYFECLDHHWPFFRLLSTILPLIVDLPSLEWPFIEEISTKFVVVHWSFQNSQNRGISSSRRIPSPSVTTAIQGWSPRLHLHL